MTITATIHPTTNALTIKATEGATVIGELTILPSDLARRSWREFCLMHGLKARLVDATALGQFHKVGEKKGKKVTESDKWEAMTALWGFMCDEDLWARRAPAGEGAGDAGLLVEAVMRVTGCGEDEAKAYVAGLDGATQAALRDRDPTIAPVVQAIRAERAARRPTVDTSEALTGLMALGKKTD